MSAFDNATKIHCFRDVYEEFVEEIPHDTAYGKKITLIHYFYANLILRVQIWKSEILYEMVFAVFIHCLRLLSFTMRDGLLKESGEY